MAELSALYERDYYAWLEQTAAALKAGAMTELDWAHLLEEIADLGKRERRAVKSLLTRLLEHWLKLTYWEASRSRNENHWQAEIASFRQQLRDALSDSPSLRPYLAAVLADCYADAREQVRLRSGLPELPLELGASLTALLGE